MVARMPTLQVLRAAMGAAAAGALFQAISLSYGGSHKTTTYLAWYVLSGVLLVAALGLQIAIHRRRGFSRKSTGKATPTGRAEAIAQLKLSATEHSQAKIVFFPAHQSPLAKEIAAVFELAGWSTNFIGTPQEPLHHRYVEGIEVVGFNTSLVGSVVSALESLGVPSIKATVGSPTTPCSNPKHQYVVESIRVTLGHTQVPQRVATD
jgi:hypothetical protein